MHFIAPDEETRIDDPSPETIADLILAADFDYWQQGGNGEAVIEDEGHSLWIKQTKPEMFFFTYNSPSEDWAVPYNGKSCEILVEDERGGDPFWIPEACFVDTAEAVEIAKEFVSNRKKASVVNWVPWVELPLTDSYPRP